MNVITRLAYLHARAISGTGSMEEASELARLGMQMLEALKNTQQHLRSGNFEIDILTSIEAAIAAAEGTET